MKEPVIIERKELECLRRHLSEAMRIFQSLGVREPMAPELTPKEQRVKRYDKMLKTNQRGKKPDHLKKENHPG